MFATLKKVTFFSLVVFVLLNINYTYAAYITKKSDTSKAVERIEKEFSNGNITKIECVKQKSKALKLKKISETICDNVKIKTAKKEEKTKKVEYIKKKEKKEKKAKKKFLKKKKVLSSEAKSWITKKVKKEKHYKTIAQIPDSDFYFTATDGKGNTFIGYINGDENSETIKIKNNKFKKIYNGKAFRDDGKTQCNVDSEIGKIKSIYTRTIIVKCTENIFIGNINQNGNIGYGVAQSSVGVNLDFTLSLNRNAAVTSLKKKKQESKEVKKVVKLEEKNIEIKDTIYPVIKIDYNNKIFKAQKFNEMVMEISKNSYQIKGIVTDIGGSIEAVRVDGRPCKVKNGCNLNDDGSFVIDRKNIGNEEIFLTAYDSGGLGTDFNIIINVLTITANINDNIPKENYYALLIGNQNYDVWEDLDTPINDVIEIGKILKTKYNFKEVVIIKDAKKSELDEAFWKMSDKLTSQDNLLIYYAGHGKKVNNLKKAFWIPVNAKNKEDRGRYWYNTDEITAHLGTIKAKHILLVSDSCYSGIYGKKRGNENFEADLDRNLEDPAYFIKMLSRVARVYLSSGNDTTVNDGMGGKHSIFAKHFIKALKQNKTTIDSLEISYKVKRGVMGTVSQNPQYNYIDELEHADGEFVFTARN